MKNLKKILLIFKLEEIWCTQLIVLYVTCRKKSSSFKLMRCIIIFALSKIKYLGVIIMYYVTVQCAIHPLFA